MKRLALLLALAPLAFAEKDRSKAPPRADLLHAVRTPQGFESFAALVEAAGVASILEGEGPYTVLAPTELAFEPIPRT